MSTAVSTQRATSQRIVWLDYAKAIGIFLVVWAHTVADAPTKTPAGDRVYQYINDFHMTLFYVLSGVGLWYKWHKAERLNYGKEVRRCAQRLLVPYAFWVMAYTALTGIVCIYRAKNIWSNMFVNIMDGITGYTAPIWFLYTLFFAEAIFLLLWQRMKAKQFDSSVFMWGGVMDGPYAGCPDGLPVI